MNGWKPIGYLDNLFTFALFSFWVSREFVGFMIFNVGVEVIIMHREQSSAQVP
jgi:hypothetical protein